MTVKINADTSDGLKFVSDTSGEIDLQTNGATKVHMDSSGNVGIGTSSPSGSLHINTSSANILIADTDDGNGSYSRVRSDASGNLMLEADVGNVTGSSGIRCHVDNTERARFRDNGRVDIGTGSYSNGAKLTLSYTSTTEQGIRCADTVTSGTHTQIQFLRGGTQCGKIECANQASTAYVTSSDYRMKENVNYSWDATTKLKQLKPAEFTWKEEFDTNKTQVQGFLAHEVSSIVPEAVSGTKDATKQEDVLDDDGVKTGTKTVPDYQGIDQSKLVPLLVKTIQELEARITALESE